MAVARASRLCVSKINGRSQQKLTGGTPVPLFSRKRLGQGGRRADVAFVVEDDADGLRWVVGYFEEVEVSGLMYFPRSTNSVFNHCTSPFQRERPNRINGNCGMRSVCTRVTISKNSSSVPKPPGM